jgi:hypothetical protein
MFVSKYFKRVVRANTDNINLCMCVCVLSPHPPTLFHTGSTHCTACDVHGNILRKINVPELGLNGSQGDYSIAVIGDVDGNGFDDIIIGSPEHYGGRGAAFIMFMGPDGSGNNLGLQEISNVYGNFPGVLNVGDNFGGSVAALGDVNGDGFVDIAVGAPNTLGGYYNNEAQGVVYVLLLDNTGIVISIFIELGYSVFFTYNFYAIELKPNNKFGSSIASLGDLNRDGGVDLVIGGSGWLNNEGGDEYNLGNSYFISINSAGTMDVLVSFGHNQLQYGAYGDFRVNEGDRFGASMVNLNNTSEVRFLVCSNI